MEDKRKQTRKVPLVRAGLIAVGLFSLLLMLTGLWSSSAKAEDDSALHVFVDGRAVAVESIEAELQGTTAEIAAGYPRSRLEEGDVILLFAMTGDVPEVERLLQVSIDFF